MTPTEQELRDALEEIRQLFESYTGGVSSPIANMRAIIERVELPATERAANAIARNVTEALGRLQCACGDLDKYRDVVPVMGTIQNIRYAQNRLGELLSGLVEKD